MERVEAAQPNLARLLSALRVRGPFRGAGGYDHHVRELVRELTRQGVAVQLIDVPNWGPIKLPAAAREPWFDELSAPVGARITLHLTMPPDAVGDRRGKRRDVNYTMFEADLAPPAWVEHNLRHDLVVVPTASSRDAWIAGGFPAERIAICPLGVNPERFGHSATPLAVQTQTGIPATAFKTRFLNVSSMSPRKNLSGLLQAWLLATEADDDALLILKLTRDAPGWQTVLVQIRALETRLNRRFAEAAPVAIFLDLLADDEMPGLFTAATHYISLSHGEGWDQPMVEAAASGLRLIAPDHSAYRAYLSRKTATLLPSQLVPARFAGDPELQQLFAGANWWEPDVDAAAAAIRAAIDGRDREPAGLREHILSNFTWEQSTRRLIEILSRLEEQTSRSDRR